MAWTPITWKDFVNTIASPDQNDLTKNAGVANAYDADAISVEQILSAVAGSGIRFYLTPGATGGIGCGLSADNPSRHWNTIDYCILQYGADLPTVIIYENGVTKWDSGGGVYTGYEIRINGSGQIEYVETGGNTLLYTSLILPTFPLFVDCSIDAYGLRVNNVMIEAGIIPVPAKVDHLMMMGIG